MQVSVITVCYNAEKTIEQTIKSVLNQSYNRIQYIIIDGKSTDSTMNIVNKYKDSISYIVSEQDDGIYDAMNKGILASTGALLFFLNADDVFFDKDTIRNVVRKFEENQTDVIFGDVIVEELGGSRSLKTHANINKLYFFDNTICHQAIFFKAEAFKRFGLFNSFYKIAGDYEWLLRAFIKNNSTYTYINIPIAVFKRGGISSSTDQKIQSLHLHEREIIKQTYFNKLELRLYSNRLFRRLYGIFKFSDAKQVR